MARYREQNDHDRMPGSSSTPSRARSASLLFLPHARGCRSPHRCWCWSWRPASSARTGDSISPRRCCASRFPYLFFVSLTAFAGGVLNTYGKFGAPAFTPVILNVVLIASALWLAPQLAEPGMALAYGVFYRRRRAARLSRCRFSRKIHAIPRPKLAATARRASGASGQLMLPAIFGSSVAQINVLLGGIIASLLGVGKISLLYYSDRLMEFPLGPLRHRAGDCHAAVPVPTGGQRVDGGLLRRPMDWSMRLVVLIATACCSGSHRARRAAGGHHFLWRRIHGVRRRDGGAEPAGLRGRG